MWKSREINCVLHLVIMYLSQKGKREHNSILTLKPWLPTNFFFIFFSIVAILSGSWAAGIDSTREKLRASLHPAVRAKGKWVWAALEAIWKILQRVKSFVFPPHVLGPRLTVLSCSGTACCGLWETQDPKLMDAAVPQKSSKA